MSHLNYTTAGIIYNFCAKWEWEMENNFELYGNSFV